jgi:DHA1 family tetracycline resistance protein-like MFS transporter
MRADRGTHAHMGQVTIADRVITSGIDPRRASRIIWLLAVSMGLLMTGFAITMPIFARRLGEFGSGVGALSLMSTAYALAGIVGSPIMGALADRIGRRPLVLGSLLSFALANIGFLLASSTEMLIVVRALQGGLSAGLFPAALGTVADIAPANKRSRWLGYVTGGAAVGWVLGPVMGGVLYDAWGFEAPFLLSAGMGLLAFAAAAVLVPETRPRAARQRAALRRRRTAGLAPTQAESFRAALPQPPSAFGILLFISFVIYSAWAFFEPQLLFYVYDDLGWTTAQFGMAAGGYGLASALGQTTLGQVGDKFGRKPPIIVGLFLFSAQFAGLIFTNSLGVVMLSFALAGLGEGLVTPAAGAFLLDISEERHRARVMGMQSSAGSLGGVVGPLLAAAVAGSLAPQSAFLGSIAVVLFGALLALVVLREPRHLVQRAAERSEVPDQRAMAARGSLRGIVALAALWRGSSDGTVLDRTLSVSDRTRMVQRQEHQEHQGKKKKPINAEKKR